ncbi:hypothetical protein FQZ97_1021440 [compost metagenome]
MRSPAAKPCGRIGAMPRAMSSRRPILTVMSPTITTMKKGSCCRSGIRITAVISSSGMPWANGLKRPCRTVVSGGFPTMRWVGRLPARTNTAPSPATSGMPSDDCFRRRFPQVPLGHSATTPTEKSPLNVTNWVVPRATNTSTICTWSAAASMPTVRS